MLYYAFSVFLVPMAQDLDATNARSVRRSPGGGATPTAGALMPWQLYLVFAAIGIACSMVLYEAAREAPII
ncbi:hypothetical protein MF672_015645 [Actinomadura sp. ATCC 31491]|uniref:Uncharacterized protein n=1 Tax=Actinomadura luzonensis TaxID=2805427 RepID=A0ABT0FS92_9ACTN|nr:hypothetical protein [Actinomadura luzonensis]MCK2215209.1 hypothetical protein [Actinomadura luzonensis]